MILRSFVCIGLLPFAVSCSSQSRSEALALIETTLGPLPEAHGRLVRSDWDDTLWHLHIREPWVTRSATFAAAGGFVWIDTTIDSDILSLAGSLQTPFQLPDSRIQCLAGGSATIEYPSGALVSCDAAALRGSVAKGELTRLAPRLYVFESLYRFDLASDGVRELTHVLWEDGRPCGMILLESRGQPLFAQAGDTRIQAPDRDSLGQAAQLPCQGSAPSP